MVCIEEVMRDGSRKNFYGTAFFISATRLLTAAHNVKGSKDKSNISQINVSRPGLSVVNAFSLAKKQMETIACTVIDKTYEPVDDLGNYMDIAILDSNGYHVPEDKWLTLTTARPSPKSTVAVIGYPGEIQLRWISDHGGLVDDEDKAQSDAKALLPRGRLTLSRGVTRENLQHIVRYNVSTCPGMSGGCVLLDGKVVGMSCVVTLTKAYILVNPIKILALCQWRRPLLEMLSCFFGKIMSSIEFKLSPVFRNLLLKHI